LETINKATDVVELCRALARGARWVDIMGILKNVEDANAESIRIVVVNYFGAVAKGAKNDKQALHALDVIDAFSRPFNQSDGMAPLLLALGRVLYSNT
jgi:hypothetical protein